MKKFSPTWYRGSEIAQAIGLTKKTVHNRALAEDWPRRQTGNRYEYRPPADLLPAAPAKPAAAPPPAPKVKFFDLKGDAAQARTLAREDVVRHAIQDGNESALRYAASQHPGLKISDRSLSRWKAAYQWFGLDGLVDQKQARVGRKPAAAALTETTRRKLLAASCEYGIGGRQDFARAVAEVAIEPDLTADERAALRGQHASKSHVPRSIRDDLRLDRVTVAEIQTGPAAARHRTAYTPTDYSRVWPGRVMTADDMTANCYVWIEWPNELGYKIVRPNLLVALDVGTLAFTKVRVVIRENNQYTKEDVWGLVGDYLDEFPAPEACLFEGGTWRSNIVKGVRTGITDEARFGGLESLGIQLRHSLLPRSKPIEQRFHQLQKEADRVKGYSGRFERQDLPEALARQLAQMRAGKVHPSEHLLHLTEYADHIARAARALNETRDDGKTLRGRTPLEAFAANPPQGERIPEHSRWLYRSSIAHETVRSDSQIQIQLKSGKFKTAYLYRHPELGKWAGRKVIVYWNHHTPETSAIVRTLRNGKADEFLCAAEYVPDRHRFDAPKDQLRADARFKNAQMAQAATVRKNLIDFTARDHREPEKPAHPRTDARPETADPRAAVVGRQLAAQARDRAAAQAEHARQEKALDRLRAAAPETDDPDELAALIDPRETNRLSLEEEMNELT